MALEFTLVLAACLAALAFRPWAMLREGPLLGAWLAVLVILPLGWGLGSLMPAALPLQFSGAALMVLMFGWPLAVLSAVPVALAAAWLGGTGVWQALDAAAWNGVVPATLALLLGMATRRWLPSHLMVYILARGFAATLFALGLTGALWMTRHALPPGLGPDTVMLGRWLMAWADAVATGMVVAVFVAFRPQWLATYSDRRYLPR